MNSLKKLFHRHKWVSFKTGRFPLVARYCEKCGIVEYGNSVYYDGSTYQNRFVGEEAVDFIRRNMWSVKNLKQNIIWYKEFYSIFPEHFDMRESMGFKRSLENYETVEEYERIIELIKEKS